MPIFLILLVGAIVISQPELVFADYNPDSDLLSFDIDVNTDPKINYGVPLGTFSGTTSEPNTDKIYITVRDPDGIKVMNILRVSDSNGYFNYLFNVGDPTVLPKEGTYTATAHIYNEAGETFDESEQAGTFVVTFENIFPVDEPEPEIISFDIDITYPDYLEFPYGNFVGQTAEGNVDKIYIAVRDPDGEIEKNILRVSDSNGYFNYAFDVGNPTVLSKEGTYTATAHVYSIWEETIEESEQASSFTVTFENIFPVVEPEPEPEPEADVIIPAGTSVPGCEETVECFLPAELSVDAGDTVTWYNDDNAAHTVTSWSTFDGQPNGIFDSSLFMAETTFDHTFDEEGEYDYFCMVHPWMTGKVIVGDYVPPEEDETEPEETIPVKSDDDDDDGDSAKDDDYGDSAKTDDDDDGDSAKTDDDDDDGDSAKTDDDDDEQSQPLPESQIKISVDLVPYQDGKMFEISGEDVLKSHRVDLTILLDDEELENLDFFLNQQGRIFNHMDS